MSFAPRLRGSAIFTLLLPLGACSGAIAPTDLPVVEPAPVAVPFPGGSQQPAPSVTPAAPPSKACADVGFQPLARLTIAQYRNAVKDLTGVEAPGALVPDGKAGGFASNVAGGLSELGFEKYADAAASIAQQALQMPKNVLPCEPATGDPCARQLIQKLGRRAYRRPLSGEEEDRLFRLFTVGKSQDFLTGARLVLEAVLQSPHFLYRVEGPGSGSVAPLTAYETASRLSFFLWSSGPDDALLEAAAGGALSSAAQIEGHARRMLADPRARGTLASFHAQWLRVEETISKDAKLFPRFSPAVARDLHQELDRGVQLLFGEGQGRLEALLTARTTFVSSPLAELYGLPKPTTEWAKVSLDPKQRAGVLTQAAFLATHAHADQTSPVRRGKVLREALLCDPVPPPPPEVNDVPPGLDPTKPTRERFAAHRDSPACAACHDRLDPLGFAFEGYDATGRFRTTEAGRPIDASGEVVGLADPDLRGGWKDAVELTERLAKSERARRCVVTQWFRFATGRTETDADTCSLDSAYRAFAASGFDLRELIVALSTSDAFRLRRHVRP